MGKIKTFIPESKCCVVKCVNNDLVSASKSLLTKFYLFPSSNTQRDKWIAIVREINAATGKTWEPDGFSQICSQHFAGKCVSKNPQRPNYVPTIFRENQENFNSDLAWEWDYSRNSQNIEEESTTLILPEQKHVKDENVESNIASIIMPTTSTQMILTPIRTIPITRTTPITTTEITTTTIKTTPITVTPITTTLTTPITTPPSEVFRQSQSSLQCSTKENVPKPQLATSEKVKSNIATITAIPISTTIIPTTGGPTPLTDLSKHFRPVKSFSIVIDNPPSTTNSSHINVQIPATCLETISSSTSTSSTLQEHNFQSVHYKFIDHVIMAYMNRCRSRAGSVKIGMPTYILRKKAQEVSMLLKTPLDLHIWAENFKKKIIESEAEGVVLSWFHESLNIADIIHDEWPKFAVAHGLDKNKPKETATKIDEKKVIEKKKKIYEVKDMKVVEKKKKRKKKSDERKAMKVAERKRKIDERKAMKAEEKKKNQENRNELSKPRKMKKVVKINDSSPTPFLRHAMMTFVRRFKATWPKADIPGAILNAKFKEAALILNNMVKNKQLQEFQESVQTMTFPDNVLTQPNQSLQINDIIKEEWPKFNLEVPEADVEVKAGERFQVEVVELIQINDEDTVCDIPEVAERMQEEEEPIVINDEDDDLEVCERMQVEEDPFLINDDDAVNGANPEAVESIQVEEEEPIVINDEDDDLEVCERIQLEEEPLLINDDDAENGGNPEAVESIQVEEEEPIVINDEDDDLEVCERMQLEEEPLLVNDDDAVNCVYLEGVESFQVEEEEPIQTNDFTASYVVPEANERIQVIEEEDSGAGERSQVIVEEEETILVNDDDDFTDAGCETIETYEEALDCIHLLQNYALRVNDSWAVGLLKQIDTFLRSGDCEELC